MTTLYDYQRVASNCSHFHQRNNMDRMTNGIDMGESCTVCEHFDERRQHCRLDLYDKIHSSLTSYYFE